MSDNMEDFDEPIDNDEAVEKNKIPPMQDNITRRGRFPSKCAKFTGEDGNEYIAVPSDLFRWVICIPYTGEYIERMTQEGLIRGVQSNLDSKDDWSLHTEVFFEGNILGPFAKMLIELARDEGYRVPKVKIFELTG